MRICLMIEGQEGVSWEEWVALAHACEEHGIEGLCPVCGVDLNENWHTHDDAEPDPRWAALAELRERL